MLESMPTPHQVDPSVALGLDVGDRRGAAARGQGVLAVVLDLEGDAEIGPQGADQGVDRAVALAHHGAGLAVDQELGRHRGAAAAGRHLAAEQAYAGVVGQVRAGEHVPHLAGLDHRARVLGHRLDLLGELDLEPAGEVEPVLGVHDVGHAALARLAVDLDDRLVGAAGVARVDGKVGDLPVVVVVADGLESLLDGVLVGAGEGRVDEVAGVGVAGVDRHAGGELGHPAHPVDVAEVEGGVDALGEEVHGQGHDVDVAGALAVAEQGALDPVGAGQHGQLGGGHRGAPVIVRVEAEDDRVAVADGAAEPLDDVGVDVGSVHLDGVGQVDDDRSLRRGLDDAPSPPRRSPRRTPARSR